MKIDKVILRECSRLAIGLLIADLPAAIVFYILHRYGICAFDYTVILGLLLGTAAAVLNFFLLGLTMQKAADRQSGQKKAVQLSYTLRMLLMGIIIVVGAIAPCFHIIATIVPLVLTTPVILIMQAIAKKKEQK